MRAQAERDEITIAYLDETVFALAYPKSGVWTPIGKCHMIDANRVKRLNVIGAMLSTGELFTVALWQKKLTDIYLYPWSADELL